MRFSGTKGQAELLRILAKHLGIRSCWHGRLMRNGKPVCQGWAALWKLACSRRWIVPYSGGTWVRRNVVCEGCRIDWRAVG